MVLTAHGTSNLPWRGWLTENIQFRHGSVLDSVDNVLDVAMAVSRLTECTNMHVLQL